MSKGISPPITKREPAPAPRTMPKGTGEEIGGGQPSTERCWTFSLAGLTTAGRNASSGMSVDGVPQGSNVIVLADSGALGYAPTGKARQMIAGVHKTGGRLRGKVLLTEPRSVEVQLCIS